MSFDSKLRPHAVVIGLDCMTGLQTARILTRRGIPVVAIANNPAHPCSQTNVCERRLLADTTTEELIECLQNLGRELPHRAVLYPCTDMSVLLISRHRDELHQWFHVVLPEPDMVEMLTDKIRFYQYAKSQGLPVPATFLVCERADAERAARELPFPCLLKPTLKTPRWEQHTKAKAYKIASAEELLRTYDQCASWADFLMVQHWIQGDDAALYSCNCYFNASSEALVTFVSRKLRQWPPEAGTSCLGQECKNDIVLNQTVKLFRNVRHRGLGYLEMKCDAESGEYFIIEPNIGRPTGRSALAEASGVELLFTQYCDALGWPLPDRREQRYRGKKWTYFRRDIQAAGFYWRRGDLTLRNWARSWRGLSCDALFSWTDPLPFLLDWKEALSRLVFNKSKRVKRTVSRLRSPAVVHTSQKCTQSINGQSADKEYVDYDIHGIVGVRLINPSSSDAAAVRKQLGPMQTPLTREPDIVVRFVEKLATEHVCAVDLHRNEFSNESFYIRQSGGRDARVRIAFDEIGHGCKILCESGARSVPLLMAIVNLTALKKGYVPLHASAFVHKGMGVLLAGWAKGGKTEALLAFAAHGAEYVGDEWVLLRADGEKVYGIPESIRLWDWHLDQLPSVRRQVGRRDRVLFKTIHAAEWLQHNVSAGTLGRTFPSQLLRRAMPALHRQLNVVIQPEKIFGCIGPLAARPVKLFLMMIHQDSSIQIEPADSLEVARRMASSVRYEQLPLLQHYLSFRFAFPERKNELIERAHELQEELLCRALAGVESWVVRHPYPVSFGELYHAMQPFVERDSARHVPAPASVDAKSETAVVA
jgi:D-aspartate ligase